MLARPLHLPPEHLYPPDEWRVRRDALLRSLLAARGDRVRALQRLRRGPRHIRGGTTGAVAGHVRQRLPRDLADRARRGRRTGWPARGRRSSTSRTPRSLRLYVDDEPLFLPDRAAARVPRVLDMREGTLTRELVWSTPAGKHVRVRSCRLVSFEHRHLVAMEYEVTLRRPRRAGRHLLPQLVNRARRPRATGWPAQTTDPRRQPASPTACSNGEIAEADGERMLLGYRTTNSGMTLVSASTTSIETDGPVETDDVASNGERRSSCSPSTPQPGVPIRITKYVAYHSSRRGSAAELVERCGRTLDRAGRAASTRSGDAARAPRPVLGPRRRQGRHRRSRAGADPAGGPLEPLPAGAGDVACRGRGRAGQGPDRPGLRGALLLGHRDLSCCRSSSYTQPRIARNLLRFRHSMLPRARRRAREMSQRGAMFPWRTINGEEASANYQAGTAQYHINADIAYAIRRYVDVRDDLDFLVEMGAEMLVETARLWEDLGFYGDDGRFHIHGVTGPGRVHDGRQRQHVHEPDGAGEPQLRGRRGPLAAGRTARRHIAALVDEVELRPAEVDVVGARRGRDVRAVRRGSGHPPAGRRLPRAGGVGPRRTRRRRSSRCCCTTTRW